MSDDWEPWEKPHTGGDALLALILSIAGLAALGAWLLLRGAP